MDALKYLTLNLLTADLSDLREAGRQTLDPTAEQARFMYHGHHLGRPIGGGETNFDYWRGPMVRTPETGTEQQKREAQGAVTEFQQALRRSFTSTNMVKEVVRRDVGSSTTSMSWTLLQADAQREAEDQRTELEKEADALASSWWKINRSHPERAIREAIRYARREGRGVLRFRVAGGLLQAGADGKTRVKAGLKLPDIANYIRLECLANPENARVWEHPDTLTRSAVYAYTDTTGTECAEACTYDEASDLTILRVVKGADLGTPTRLKLGGRITYLELAEEAIITPQFLQNQMAYNTASTMILRNTELAGFLERYGINVEPPYDVVTDPDNPGQTRRQYKSVKPGAGSMMLWRQATYRKADAQGKYLGDEPLGTAQYGRFEPVKPEALISATGHNQLNMYSEVGQSYVLMGKDATASGRSREVAISDFDTIRAPTIDLGEATIGQVIEVFLALVAALGNQPGRFETIQVDGSVKARIVPPSSEDRKADRDDVTAGIISRATARQRQGIDDPAQEDAQIQREQAQAPPVDTPPADPPADGPPA